jgi:hypothetical protein
MNILRQVMIEGFGNVANDLIAIHTNQGNFLIFENEIPYAWKVLDKKMRSNIPAYIEYGARPKGFLKGEDFIHVIK